MAILGPNELSVIERCPYHGGVCKERLDCRNDMRENKNYFGRFKSSQVWVTEGKVTVHVNAWQKSRGNRFWIELAPGSSYRESTVSLEKEKDIFCVLFTYSIRRACEIRKFHVAVVQWRQRNVQNSMMPMQNGHKWTKVHRSRSTGKNGQRRLKFRKQDAKLLPG